MDAKVKGGLMALSSMLLPGAAAEWAFDLPHVGGVEIAHLPRPDAGFYISLAVCFALLCIAGTTCHTFPLTPKKGSPLKRDARAAVTGILSTLTISLISQDVMALQLLMKNGTPSEQKYGTWTNP